MEKKVIININNLPAIEGITIQINQLIYNLLGNAIKFSGNNLQPVITIGSRILNINEVSNHAGLNPSLSYCEISFKDNGIGFDQQFADEIFLIFHTLNSNLQYSGTGIGLALCRKIVDNHHGKIIAEGKVNEGASFYIILPVKQPE